MGQAAGESPDSNRASVRRRSEAVLERTDSFIAAVGAASPAQTAKLLAAASDVALLVDPDGRIRDTHFARPGALQQAAEHWRGRAWAETVVSDSLPKIEALQREASENAETRLREVNHILPNGGDTPVRYAAIRLGGDGAILALGQDIAGLAELQRRLVRAQVEIDREHARIRGAEKRFRALFQLTTEPILLVEAATGRVIDANPAAETFFSLRGRDGRERPFAADLFAEGDAPAVRKLMNALAAGVTPDEIVARSASRNEPFRVHGSLFRDDGEGFVVLRAAWRLDAAHSDAPPAIGIYEVLRDMPDGFVVADDAGRLRDANAAFVDMIGAATIEAIRDRPMDQWFERPGVDYPAMMATLRENGLIRRFPTRLRDAFGDGVPVEIAAAASQTANPRVYGFSIRAAAPAIGGVEDIDAVLSRSSSQLASLIGQVPLKDLVREAADAIERLSIDAALKLTGGNRASAAQLLGLSRQSLYAKLRRYGYIESSDEDAL